MTPDGGKAIQSKHYGSEVGERVLRQYDSDVDVLASTKGVSEHVDASKYDSEIITSEDWPIWARARLETNRVKRGFLRGLQHSIRSVAKITRKLSSGGEHALRQLMSGTRLAGKFASSVAMRAGSKFMKFPITAQFIIIIVFFGGLLWLLWRKWRGKYTHRDLAKWLAFVGSILVVLAVRDWWKNRE